MKLLLISAGKKIIKIIERQTLVEKMFTNSNTSVAEKCQLSMCYGSSLNKCPIRARPSLERGYETDTWPAKMHSVLYILHVNLKIFVSDVYKQAIF